MDNKKLKFDVHLIPLILNRTKVNTWRMFDDKNLTTGDLVDFLNTETKEKFATAKLTKVSEKRFSELSDDERVGHEKFNSIEDMYNYYSKVYKQPVTSQSLVKVIWFELL
jgi:hypothetical protein